MMKGILGMSVLEWARKKKREEWLSLGLKYQRVDLNDGQGTVIYMWVSSQNSSSNQENKRPWVVLIHDFGADALSGWETDQVKGLVKNNWQVAVVDLLFLGGSESTTESHESTEVFQAECVKKALDELRIEKVTLVGHGYGGFVAFWMTNLYEPMVIGLAIIASAICMKPHDKEKLVADYGCNDLKDLLIPENGKDVIKALKFSFYGMPLALKLAPGFVTSDLLQVFGGNRERKIEMLDNMLIGSENCPPLPALDTFQKENILVIWGENDRIFPLEHAYNFKRHVEDAAEMVIIKQCGHAPQTEKPSQFTKALLNFLSKKWPH